jgi:hypothetical protein
MVDNTRSRPTRNANKPDIKGGQVVSTATANIKAMVNRIEYKVMILVK